MGHTRARFCFVIHNARRLAGDQTNQARWETPTSAAPPVAVPHPRLGIFLPLFAHFINDA